MCMDVQGLPKGRRTGRRISGTGVTGNWRASDMDAGNETGVLCKNKECSWLLSRVSSPMYHTFQTNSGVFFPLRTQEVPTVWHEAVVPALSADLGADGLAESSCVWLGIHRLD